LFLLEGILELKSEIAGQNSIDNNVIKLCLDFNGQFPYMIAKTINYRIESISETFEKR
jgi:hypothetical protein